MYTSFACSDGKHFPDSLGLFWRAAVLLICAGPTYAGPPVAAYDRFFDRVRPLLEAKCITCHGPDKVKGGLRLDSFAAARKGGSSGPALVPGDPGKSLLVQMVRHADPDHKMPPKEKLSDTDVTMVETWVREGAVWPSSVQVLFEDDAWLPASLAEGGGEARLDPRDRYAGTAGLVVKGQRMNPRVGSWNFPIRKRPKGGEYRYLRFAWKKRGGGGMVFEVANGGRWRNDPKQANAAWSAGPNTTGWAAHSIADAAPTEWTVVTRDLWKDGGDWGDFNLTGLCITAISGEVLLDSIVLGPDLESLDAYRPGRGLAAASPTARHGNAWIDPANPVRQVFRGKRLDLWSLKKPVRPAVPTVKDAGWCRNAVDRFVLAALEAKGLRPSAEANRRTLIRRLTFDLTGLPPTSEEVDAFCADPTPHAYEALVERLLASPHYGERWGRHWLDVVRYADTNGFERDEYRPDAWRYRDYVVRSFGEDKPFDRFVTEQLAGDESADGPVRTPEDAERWIATGFLRMGVFDSTAALFGEGKKSYDELIADLVNTTGSAFLGLTLACCQCHHHKYDPLVQEDHYRLRAFFAAVKKDDAFVLDPPEVTARKTVARQRAERLRRIVGLLTTGGRTLIQAERVRTFPAEVRRLLLVPADKRDEAARKKLAPYLKKLKVGNDEALAGLPPAIRRFGEHLRSQLRYVEQCARPDATALVMTDAGSTAPTTHVLFQGDFTQPRHAVEPGFLSVFDPNPATILAPLTGTTGRRLALARWIVSRNNPLTARVAVNRLWVHHFGRGIVTTPNDFGFSGARPSHPELLDWLAVEFMDRNWSIKAMHRLLVSSAAYRQTSAADAERSRLDPDNRLLWRQNPRRLDAESLRDALLAVSGRLQPLTGGPPRWPPVEEEVLLANSGIVEARAGGEEKRLQDYRADPVERTDVRSLYLVQKRSVPYPFLQPFDLPDPTVSCACRASATVAPQGLALLNSPEAARLARRFANRVAAEAGPDRARRVERAVRLAFGRAPASDEAHAAAAFLQRATARYSAGKAPPSDPADAALVDLCRALMNVNEFIYVD